MIGVGMELELFLFHKDGYGFYLDNDIWNSDITLEKFSLEREYYCGMVEMKFFNQRKQKLNQIFKNIDIGIENKLYSIKKFYPNIVIPYKSLYFLKYNGIISNGVHVHIELPNKYIDSPFKRVYSKLLSAYVFKEKMKVSPSLRFLYSHHLWGRWIPSNYSFKMKNKFSPVYFSPSKVGKPLTVEIRAFDVEDLVDSSNRKWVFKIIKKIISFIMRPKNMLTIDDTTIQNFEDFRSRHSLEIYNKDGEFIEDFVCEQLQNFKIVRNKKYKVFNSDHTYGLLSPYDFLLNRSIGESSFDDLENVLTLKEDE